jgi:hypothetical protein
VPKGYKKKDYNRLSVNEIEAILPEVLETYSDHLRDYKFTLIANHYNIEPGILMLLMSGLWNEFKISYQNNTDSGHYKTFAEYLEEKT